MPRTNLLPKKTNDLYAQTIRSLIAGAEARLNLPRSETVRASRMSSANFYKAWHDPGLFRLEQITLIFDFLKIDPAELTKAMEEKRS